MHAFQAAVLDPVTGSVVEARFAANRECLGRWVGEWRGRVVAVAIEAMTGWRWVGRVLVSYGLEVRLAEPVQARALLGRRRRSAKTDRLDARWLARLLAKEMLPASWIPRDEIQQLRDRTRLRKALAEDRRRWGQRLHAFLLHEGWPCSKARLLTPASASTSVARGAGRAASRTSPAGQARGRRRPSRGSGNSPRCGGSAWHRTRGIVTCPPKWGNFNGRAGHQRLPERMGRLLPLRQL